MENDKKTFCVTNTEKFSIGFCCLICEQPVRGFPQVTTAPICDNCLSSLRSIVEAENQKKRET